MKERLLQWFSDNKVIILTLLSGLIAAIVGCTSCTKQGLIDESIVARQCQVINDTIKCFKD